MKFITSADDNTVYIDPVMGMCDIFQPRVPTWDSLVLGKGGEVEAVFSCPPVYALQIYHEGNARLMQ